MLACGTDQEAVGYSDAGQTVVGNDSDEVPFGIEGVLGGAYQLIGQPERAVEFAVPNSRAVATHDLTREARSPD